MVMLEKYMRYVGMNIIIKVKIEKYKKLTNDYE